jgi:hypothetical protein
MFFKMKITSGDEVKFAGIPDVGPTYYGGPPPESGCWKLDVVRLEDYIDNEIADASFGESVETFVLGFEIAELEGWSNFFTSMSNYTSYRPKEKALISVGQLNWPDVKDLDEQAQLTCFTDALLAAVSRIRQMKRKPRSFDVDRFLTRLRSILAACPVSEVTARTA